MSTDLEIIIVNYCTEKLLARCVESILETGHVSSSQLIVVDNNSPDGSGQRIKDALGTRGIRVFCNSENRGFGAGVNFGFQQTTAPFVMVVNPDTVFHAETLSGISDVFRSDPRVGVLGLELLNPDGTLQFSARRFYTLLDVILRRTFLGRWRQFEGRVRSHLMADEDRSTQFEADWVMGTGFVVRREAFIDVGAMDEAYFLYFEDVDLCARMWLKGWRVVCLPSAKLVHDHQRSSKAGVLSRAGRWHLESMARFWRKFSIPLVRRPRATSLRPPRR